MRRAVSSPRTSLGKGGRGGRDGYRSSSSRRIATDRAPRVGEAEPAEVSTSGLPLAAHLLRRVAIRPAGKFRLLRPSSAATPATRGEGNERRRRRRPPIVPSSRWITTERTMPFLRLRRGVEAQNPAPSLGTGGGGSQRCNRLLGVAMASGAGSVCRTRSRNRALGGCTLGTGQWLRKRSSAMRLLVYAATATLAFALAAGVGAVGALVSGNDRLSHARYYALLP